MYINIYHESCQTFKVAFSLDYRLFIALSYNPIHIVFLFSRKRSGHIFYKKRKTVSLASARRTDYALQPILGVIIHKQMYYNVWLRRL